MNKYLKSINTILQGQVLEVLKELPDGCIDTIVTSPPYYKVRDYKVDGQWGLEKNPLEYLSKMDELLRELHRVLKYKGVLGLNIGDTIDHSGWIGIPESLYMYAKAIDFYGISKAVWYKRNAMPSSTKKRLSPKYEMLYLLGKTKDYNFDLDAIRVPAKTLSKKFNVRVRDSADDKYGQLSKRSEKEKDEYDTVTGIKKQDSTLGEDGKAKSNYSGFNGRYDHNKVVEQGKNPGDVLDITVKRNPEGHYAVFPEDIPEFVIKASCPADGIVLDPFAGSGTTLAVAKRLGRHYLGIELKQDYIDNALKRINLIPQIDSIN